MKRTLVSLVLWMIIGSAGMYTYTSLSAPKTDPSNAGRGGQRMQRNFGSGSSFSGARRFWREGTGSGKIEERSESGSLQKTDDITASGAKQ